MFVCPIVIAFDLNMKNSITNFIYYHISSVIFLLDLFIIFNLGFYDEGIIVKER